jgi:anti-anti-sigma factor
VAGELDLASRAVFGRVLNARLAVSPWLRVDVGDLSYAEAGALAVLYQAASWLNGDGGIVVAGAAHQLRRVIDLAGFSHAQVIFD